MSSSSKVFCANCAYFSSCKKSKSRMQFDDYNSTDLCNAPQNIRDTYRTDGKDKYISSPSIINKYNNCSWFVAKVIDNIGERIEEHNSSPTAHPTILNAVNQLQTSVTQLNTKMQSRITAYKNASGALILTFGDIPTT